MDITRRSRRDAHLADALLGDARTRFEQMLGARDRRHVAVMLTQRHQIFFVRLSSPRRMPRSVAGRIDAGQLVLIGVYDPRLVSVGQLMVDSFDALMARFTRQEG